MKTRVALALLFALLVALCAWGQTFQRSLPFLARSSFELTFTPTNLPGWYSTNNKAYYIATTYYTNGGKAMWTNLWEPGVNDLTNTTLQYTPTRVGSLLCFTGWIGAPGTIATSTWLRAQAFGLGPPQEPSGRELSFCVLDRAFNTVTDAFWFDGNVSRNVATVQFTSPGGRKTNYSIWAGAADYLFAGVRITNKPCMVSFVFNGANSAVYTNAVLAGTGDAGANRFDDLIMGARYQDVGGGVRYWGGIFDVYEIAIYRAVCSDAQRSNLWFYWKTKYTLSD